MPIKPSNKHLGFRDLAVVYLLFQQLEVKIAHEPAIFTDKDMPMRNEHILKGVLSEMAFT